MPEQLAAHLAPKVLHGGSTNGGAVRHEVSSPRRPRRAGGFREGGTTAGFPPARGPGRRSSRGTARGRRRGRVRCPRRPVAPRRARSAGTGGRDSSSATPAPWSAIVIDRSPASAVDAEQTWIAVRPPYTTALLMSAQKTWSSWSPSASASEPPTGRRSSTAPSDIAEGLPRPADTRGGREDLEVAAEGTRLDPATVSSWRTIP